MSKSDRAVVERISAAPHVRRRMLRVLAGADRFQIGGRFRFVIAKQQMRPAVVDIRIFVAGARVVEIRIMFRFGRRVVDDIVVIANRFVAARDRIDKGPWLCCADDGMKGRCCSATVM